MRNQVESQAKVARTAFDRADAAFAALYDLRVRTERLRVALCGANNEVCEKAPLPPKPGAIFSDLECDAAEALHRIAAINADLDEISQQAGVTA